MGEIIINSRLWKVTYNLKKLHILFNLFFLLWCNLLIAQIKNTSWNLQNFGKTKSESEIEFVDDILRDFDVVALQEIVEGYGGTQALARLADALNRKGAK